MQMCENKAVREITNQVQKDMLIKEDTDMAKTLIAFFSRADENYFGGAMRYVKVGNTEIVVSLMKELIEADSFKIEMKDPYSPVYMTCIDQAKKDLRAGVRHGRSCISQLLGNDADGRGHLPGSV